MMQSNKRKLNLLLFVFACVFISVAATKPSTATQQVTTKDTGLFKNLKVLPNDISKAQLDTIMHRFNAALGVKCNFCHAFKDGKPDFPSDEKKEKDIARYMLHMTSEINIKYFNFENSAKPDTISVVKCVTCHHGNPHPDEAAMATPSQNGMPPPPPPPPPMHDSTGKTPPPPNQK
jgi:transcriptional regulator of met regulon